MLDAAGEVDTHIAHELSELEAEDLGHQRTRQIKTLLAKVISVVFVASAQHDLTHTVDHVTEEESLSGLTTLSLRDMGQEFLLQDIASITNTLFLATHLVTTLTDEVKSVFAVLNDEGLFQTRLDHLAQLSVVCIVADAVKNLHI